MFIQDMFRVDIHRKINGVIKVDQDAEDVIEQEVREYVITRELKKHFISFFNFYASSFDEPTADIGVWISGFFGSGKSHFLKMLSYILRNREINGVKTVERFREKFEDDSATYMMVDKSTKAETETILFNIDIEGLEDKNDTAVLRVMAKVFFNHLGYYGTDLKVVMLEKYLAQCGKTEAFERAFEKHKGMPWRKMRKAYKFNVKAVVATLMEVLDMSEADAMDWIKDKTSVNYSIAQLVEDIKEYVNSKPANFRLLFMIDEVGQYIGDNTSLLLNLQSIVEKLGSECRGKVWVICTGQEAIDDIIKVKADEFSRIQARFKTRLSLTSSSVDEVIQKRILKKTESAENKLVSLYHENDSVLRNLFTFSNSILDIKGFTGAQSFVIDFPFVPYQFIIMQKVFAEIRKHGNTGKHISGGERSMLSGFQEAAQALCLAHKDEYALVPFYLFYDTLHTFLDSPIRRVIERCQNAADAGDGIEAYDVNVLKLLYLIRYLDDIRSSLDNIAILMADDIRTDKITLREKIQNSLDRLMSQNYIGHSGDRYIFLTDDEQDVQREIKNTPVDTAAIVERISQIIFGDIYQAKKFRYHNKYDFDYDKRVDNIGSVSDNMALHFLTDATDKSQKNDMQLHVISKKQAIVALDEQYGYDCYEALERSLKIRRYIKQRNVAQLPKTIQDIIKSQNDDANAYELTATELLRKAIEHARFFINGERLMLKSGDAKAKLDQALDYLVAHVYSDLDFMDTNYESDKDILDILAGHVQRDLKGNIPNAAAVNRVEEYLNMQNLRKMPTSMNDIQNRYQGIPYGWREIDIAAVVAQLIHDQKVTVKYAGQVIRPDHKELINYLRRKTEIAKTRIEKRQIASAADMRAVIEFLREYLEVMDVPKDEDGLVKFIVSRFEALRAHDEELLQRYLAHPYPDKEIVKREVLLVTGILGQQNDNIALITAVLNARDDLLDSKDDMHNVESFFKTQVQVFDAALALLAMLRDEHDYLDKDETIRTALEQIRTITAEQPKFNYRRIPDLNALMRTVTDGHNTLLLAKREELNGLIAQCLKAMHEAAAKCPAVKRISDDADAFYAEKKQRVSRLESLALLDALKPVLIEQKDIYDSQIADILAPKPVIDVPKPGKTPEVPSKVKIDYHRYARQVVFPVAKINTEADVEVYVKRIRDSLLAKLKDGAIEIN
ncbi:MAG: BREX system P-loop protein BrxC [Proteobacteria bacterium]|nr:BREX system P-loop protein BrxC [Pseudomonadota bacterium]